jgi:hypothetical protein
MCYENNNKAFTLEIRCALLNKYLSIKGGVLTGLK